MGGIGDDAHFIGLRLLELGFSEFGYYVTNIGIRNELDDFFNQAKHYDVIMISCKNGHADFYLDDFARSLSHFKLYNNEKRLWYLGGSLSIGEDDQLIKKKYINLGFTNVYPRPVHIKYIAEDIKQNLVREDIKLKKHSEYIQKVKTSRINNFEELQGGLLSFSDLKNIRSEVMNGSELKFQDFIPPPGRSMHEVLKNTLKLRGTPLLQCRTGVADISQQQDILAYLEKNGSSISSTQLDAASRSKFYHKSKEGILKSKKLGYSVLNGFPLQSYEPGEVRKMIGSLKTPFQLRAGGPDHRYTYERALMSGVSGLEGGFICYSMPYDKITSPYDSFRNWRYIDRLCSLYTLHTGVEINREYFGTLTASLIEPSIAIVVNIIQALLSAEQGVKSISVGYAEQGNRVQDVAAMHVLRETVYFYLKEFRYSKVQVSTVFQQYMSAFPEDRSKAEDIIFNSAITGTLASANRVIVKTDVEAIKIPDRKDNARALKFCQNGIKAAKDVKIDLLKVSAEQELLRRQVSQLMQAIIYLGQGNIAAGAIKAIYKGILDIPFSPNQFNNNEVVTVRDASGAVRFYSFGQMPFSEDIKSFHNAKVEYREKLERDGNMYSLVEKDLTRIWMGDYKKWPLDDSYIT